MHAQPIILDYYYKSGPEFVSSSSDIIWLAVVDIASSSHDGWLVHGVDLLMDFWLLILLLLALLLVEIVMLCCVSPSSWYPCLVCNNILFIKTIFQHSASSNLFLGVAISHAWSWLWWLDCNSNNGLSKHTTSYYIIVVATILPMRRPMSHSHLYPWQTSPMCFQIPPSPRVQPLPLLQAWTRGPLALSGMWPHGMVSLIWHVEERPQCTLHQATTAPKHTYNLLARPTCNLHWHPLPTYQWQLTSNPMAYI